MELMALQGLALVELQSKVFPNNTPHVKKPKDGARRGYRLSIGGLRGRGDERHNDAKLFAVPLDVCLDRNMHAAGLDSRPLVPSFIQEAMLAIEKKGLGIPGLFRVSGSARRVREIRALLDQGERVDMKVSDVYRWLLRRW